MPTEVEFREERAALEAVLSAEIFLRSPSLVQMLRYICEKHFGGQAHAIKEYNIAVEALARPPEFDQTRDSIVRVEAHRLRKRLQEYYRHEGAGQPIRIVIPPGNYAPQFVRQIGSIAPEAPAELPAPERRSRWEFWALGCALALISVLSGVLIVNRSSVTAKAPVAGALPAGAVLPSAAVPLEEVRILAGFPDGRFLEPNGNTWSGDRFFSGGVAQAPTHPPIAYAAPDSTVFDHRRRGNFSYAIPLKPGYYELRLYFAESFFGENNPSGGGEASRIFGVRANGKDLLRSFDVVADAPGANTADIRVFKDIQPSADGLLHLAFISNVDTPFVNGIEIVPARRGASRPVRIAAREFACKDSRDQVWSGDRYYLRGRLGKPLQPVAGDEPVLYRGERYGNFAYSIPVAMDGRYTVSLRFCESYFGPDRPGGNGVGARVFDVYLNGRTLLRQLDVFKEAGSLRGLVKTFRGLEPNVQGKLVFSFVPVRNYATVSAIEVVDEAWK